VSKTERPKKRKGDARKEEKKKRTLGGSHKTTRPRGEANYKKKKL